MKIQEIKTGPTFKGTPTSQSVILNGRTLKLELDNHDARLGYKIVFVKAKIFDKAFEQDTHFYVGSSGEGGIGKRYIQFGEWVSSAESMITSTVNVDNDGSVGFTNGRHRYAYMRDNNVVLIPVAMDDESIKNAKRYGYV